MATLYVTECTSYGTAGTQFLIDAPAMPAVNQQTLSITTTSTTSTTFNARTNMVILSADATCSVIFSATSATVTATTASMRIPANTVPQRFGVTPGGLIAVISNS